MEVLIANDEVILAQLNVICAPNYNVFSHVRVPKIMIPMNVLVDATSNVERENLGAKGDGNDVQLRFIKGSNMR